MARKKQDDQLTPLELEIMKVLWSTGQATVQAVCSALGPDRDLAYNTIQTMLTVLHRKGRVVRELRERAYVYRPAVSQELAAGQAVSTLLDRMFDGRPEELVLSMVKSRRLTPEKLAELQKIVEEMSEDGGDD